MSDWMDLELADQLSPVSAPDALWDRIQAGRPTPVKAPIRWPIAAAITLITAAATLWLLEMRGEQPLNLQELAAQELHDTRPLDFRTSDPVEVGRWMQAKAALSPGLPANTPVRILGARIIRRAGQQIGAIRYEAAGAPAVLLIAQAGGADSAHGHLTWRTRGQSFALACDGPSEAACNLCHL
jgi:hypothetical protein